MVYLERANLFIYSLKKKLSLSNFSVYLTIKAKISLFSAIFIYLSITWFATEI